MSVTSNSRVGGSYRGGSVNRKSTVAKRTSEFVDRIDNIESALSYNGLDQDEESKGRQNQEEQNQEQERQFSSHSGATVTNIYEAQEADQLYIQQNQASRQINVYDSNNDIFDDELSGEESASLDITKRDYFEYDELAE